MQQAARLLGELGVLLGLAAGRAADWNMEAPGVIEPEV
jgi:hypothetical protein